MGDGTVAERVGKATTTTTTTPATRWLRAALYLTASVLWAAIVRLAVAFVSSDLTFRLVAEQSRRTAPWPYRLAGMWWSAEGSLLLFTGIVAAVVSVAAVRMSMRQTTIALGTVVALAAIVMVLTDPFERLAFPAIEGFGLTPILEHPAMAVDPSLLYAGLAMAFPAALVAFDPGGGTIDIRRWLLACIAWPRRWQWSS